MRHHRNHFPHERIRWYLLGGAAAVAAAVMFFENDRFYKDFREYATLPSGDQSWEDTARFTLDFGDGRRRTFVGTVASGMTILSTLRAAEVTGRFSAVTDARGTLVEIAGIRSSHSRQWQAYRNNAPVADLLGHVEVQPGDRIMLRYE